jgi:hypothetical protein
MSLQVLLSTMHQSQPVEYLERAALRGGVVVVNQNNHTNGCKRLPGGSARILVDSTGRGLSRSRNLALEKATAEICLLADDDEIFVSSYEERILRTFARFPQSDVIAFSVHNRDGLRKSPLQARRLNRLSLMKVSSVQVAFRRKAVVEAGVHFDTDFGAGARYPMGEELVFLCDLHRAGLRMAAVPLEIAHLEPGESSWFTGYDERFFRARGASFARAEPYRWHVYAAQWAIRKRRAYEPAVGLADALRWMHQGATEWRARKDL